MNFSFKTFAGLKIIPTFAPVIETTIYKRHNGAIAQLVEQRTENPCVPGSIPGGTTENQRVTPMSSPSLFLPLCDINSTNNG